MGAAGNPADEFRFGTGSRLQQAMATVRCKPGHGNGPGNRLTPDDHGGPLDAPEYMPGGSMLDCDIRGVAQTIAQREGGR
jgi:hypothetical protein